MKTITTAIALTIAVASSACTKDDAQQTTGTTAAVSEDTKSPPAMLWGLYYAHDYSYVLPQVETIAQISECAPRFSFLSLDRSTTPPSLLTGEYDAESVAGRLYRLPLQSTGGKPALIEGLRLYPDEAFFAGHSHVQGALSVDGTYWLSSSKPTQGAGILYRTAPNTPTSDRAWNDSPEDMAYDPARDGVWSLSEGLNARYVFRVARSAID